MAVHYSAVPPGRPRLVSDAAVLAATERALSRLGPRRLTLAAVAQEAGLAPATLVQRFGSKHALLLAFAEEGARAGVARLEALLAELPVPAALAALAAPLADADALVNHLGVLQEELADPPRRAIVARQARGFRGALADALRREEDPPEDAEALARTLHTTWNGSLVTWAMVREGPLDAWLRRDLAAVMDGGGVPA